MIKFKDWQIWADPRLSLQQNDHLSRELIVSGPLPEGWEWTMLVQVDGQMDLWPLQPRQEGGVSAVLTAQQLGPGGFYRMQLRGLQGEVTRHTNVITLFVPRSLCGDKQWPVLPTEFSDAEQRILSARDMAEHHASDAARAAEQAEKATEHYPHIENGTWWVWSAFDGFFIDTGVEARGAAVYYSNREPSFSYDGHWSDPVTGINNGGYDLPEGAIDSELHPVQERDLILAVGYCWQVDWVDGGFVYLKRLFSMVGPQGERGEAGAAGTPGTDGRTPERGVDYWTPDDIGEIKAYVDQAILGGAW